MFALRDFRYRDLQTGQTVEVHAGEAVGEHVLAMHRDPEKLIRTKFVAAGDAPVEAPVKRKRGRPKKYPS